jgi:hypothetical protein
MSEEESMRQFSVYALVLGLATVLSARIEGSCHIEAVDVCKLTLTSDISHDEATPIVAARALANGVVISEYRNDAINPFTDLGIPGRTVGGDSSLAARCGQTYILELQAQATDDVDFKSVATTRGIPCPASVP